MSANLKQVQQQQRFNKSPVAPAGHATIRTEVHGRMVRSKLNVRRKATDVAELAALIQSQGLLQNLVGYPQTGEAGPTGVIEIVAGARRLAAIGQLIEAGALPADYQIPYLEVTADEAVEISLAENLGRANMHPADVFEAMLELSDRGRSIDDIALGFGIDCLTVRRRLKLANVAPRLLDLYRNDEANFEQMMALAISDDHAAQQQAWDGLSPHCRHPHELRRLLTAQQINVQTDRLARFVGIEAFEQAGGVVVRDLFSNSGAGYISDVGLLERLAAAKLENERAALATEGHGWIELLPRADHAALSEFARVRTTTSELSEEQNEELTQLDAEEVDLELKIAALDDEDCDEGLQLARALEHVDSRRDEINSSRTAIVLPSDRALSGAVITLDEAGNVVVRRDLVRPADKSKMLKVNAAGSPEEPGGRRTRSVHSDRLTRVLTSHRTAALQAEMIGRPDVALVIITHSLLCKLLTRYGTNRGCARVTLTEATLAEETRESEAVAALAARRQQILDSLPPDDGQTWLDWLYQQPQAVVLDLLAYCVASSLDTVQDRDAPSPAFSVLGRALKLDMSRWWTAEAATYFNHVSKERIMAVVAEAVSPQAAVPLEKMKREAAAQAAERAMAGVSWLPEPLRLQ